MHADVDPLDPATESEGFEAFYLREYHAVVRLAYALSGSRLVAEDIAQEAFLQAFREWETIRHPSAWVRKLAVRRAGWIELPPSTWAEPRMSIPPGLGSSAQIGTHTIAISE